jgi:hypothetical protein
MTGEVKNGYGTIYTALALVVLLASIGSAFMFPIRDRVFALEQRADKHEALASHAGALETLATLRERLVRAEEERALLRHDLDALTGRLIDTRNELQGEMRTVADVVDARLEGRVSALQAEFLREIESAKDMRLEQISGIRSRLDMIESILLKPAFNSINGKPDAGAGR